MNIQFIKDHVIITPHTRENIIRAYELGYITYETMKNKLKNFDSEHELMQEAF